MIFWAAVNVAVSLLFGLLIKAPLMRAYLILNYVLIVNPVFMWFFLDISHPKFIPGHESYATALIFMVLFNSVLCISFMLLMIGLPRSRLIQNNLVNHRLNKSTHIRRFVAIVFLLMAVSVVAKVVLDNMGAYRMLGGGSNSPFLQLMKVLSAFDLLAIILLGEYRMSFLQRRRMIDYALIFLLSMSFFLALKTGSRSQSVTVLIIAALSYRDVLRRYWFIVYPSMALALPTIFVLFPLLATYRGAGYDIGSALSYVENIGGDELEIMLDVIVTRLNYLESVARAVDYVQFHGPAGGAVYWNNIIGIIPRLIWPGKPHIANDSQELGHQLGLVSWNDTTTSIGLQPVGEAFYEFAWIGLWVAVFQALIFTLIHKNFFRPGRPAAIAVYIFASFYILQRDGYFAVIPGLIWLSIGILLFFSAFTLLLPKQRVGTFHEMLPSRLPH